MRDQPADLAGLDDPDDFDTDPDTDPDAEPELEPADPSDRVRAKRDKTARLLRVVHILEAYGEQGVKPQEIARQTDMAVRTVYRDLRAIEGELGIPVWSEDGRWGVEAGAFLPPLRLTTQEAMAVVLSARLMTRYADRYDPNLASAFQKLEAGLPEALREHVERAVAVLSERGVDAAFNRRLADLTQAWADRRVVEFRYTPATYDGVDREPRLARVRPYLLQPSLTTHALYLMGLDETRDAMRTFKIERIVDLRVTNDRFDAPDAGRPGARPAPRLGHHRRPGRGDRGAAVRAVGRRPGAGGDLASDAGGPRGGGRLAPLDGTRRRHDRGPTVGPVVGR